MMYIAHRGNISTKFSDRENSPSYLDEAISAGFYVEIDLWGVQGKFWFGHDKPQHVVHYEYVQNIAHKSFFHCKNVEAIDLLSDFVQDAHYFVHDTDDYTITSKGLVWCYPGKTPPKRNAIIVLPETFVDGISFYLAKYNAVGVCSDYVNDLIL